MVEKKNVKKKALTAAQILSGGDDAIRELEVPEWSQGDEVGVVYLADPKAGDVLEFAAKQELKKNDPLADVDTTADLCTLIAKCIVDEKGERIFDESTAMDLKNASIRLFNRFASAVTELAEEAAAEGNESSEATDSASPTP